MNDDLLETLQADITAILQAAPALVDAVILADNEGEIEGKVARALAPLSGGPTVKSGLAVVVLLPEVTEAEANLPGPPLLVKCEIRTLENVIVNRAATGTGKRSSQAALAVLAALHRQALGSHEIYAEKNPVEPVEVKAGHVSHAVSLYARANGLQGAGKPAPVEVEMAPEGALYLLDPQGNVSGLLLPAPPYNYVESWTTDGGENPPDGNLWSRLSYSGFEGVGQWEILAYYNNIVEAWYGPVQHAFPPLPPDGQNFTHIDAEFPPVTLIRDAVFLTCATPGAAIYYTLDGTYPTPSNGTLAYPPFPAPAVGTTVRAAAYLPDQNPGDCLEFIITE